MASPGRMIRPEELAKRYAGQWVISQILNPDGTRGDWTADSCQPTEGAPSRLTARSVASLAEQLAKVAR